jgi:hypothetical protein
MVFEKLFNWGKKDRPEPAISFGRYSDNNKTVEKVNRWTDADNLFKQQQYHQSIEAFFDYLSDDNQQNVVFEKKGEQGSFSLYQGSKIVRGEFSGERIQAEITLAKMPQPSIPVMRRLLEMNFGLYYSRYALDGNRLCMRFDSDIKTANPNKLYYGLKELAIKADKQDDLLVQEFASLESMDTDHLIEMAETEKEIKYRFLIASIKETLDLVGTLDAEKMVGGVSYLLLTLALRIDYLICPEGKLLTELEKIIDIYYRQGDQQTITRNQAMIAEFRKWLDKKPEHVYPFLFRSRHSFAIVSPQNHKTISDSIASALQNVVWYRDNGYHVIANRVLEYGISFCQFSYSLPKPLSDLFRLFMHVNYGDFFQELGFSKQYYTAAVNRFQQEEIFDEIEKIVGTWKAKYPKFFFNSQTLKFESLVSFNTSFVTELGVLNFDA